MVVEGVEEVGDEEAAFLYGWDLVKQGVEEEGWRGVVEEELKEREEQM